MIKVRSFGSSENAQRKKNVIIPLRQAVKARHLCSIEYLHQRYLHQRMFHRRDEIMNACSDVS